MSSRAYSPGTVIVGVFALVMVIAVAYTMFTRPATPSRVPFALTLPSSFATGTTTLSPSDYTIRSPREVEYVNDGAILSAIPEFQSGWRSLAFSLVANRAIASERVTRSISLDDTSLTSNFTLDGLSVATNYKVMKKDANTHSLDNVAATVKQTVILTNTTDTAITTDLSVTHVIPSDTFTYDGAIYTATEAPQTFKAYQKTASIPEYAKDIGYPDPEKAKQWERLEHTYTAGTRITWETADGRTAIYDWSDAVHLAHEVTVHKEDGRTILTFRVTDITVPAHGKTEIDPNYALSNAAAYGTRVDGETATEYFSSSIAIGDVNGDGKNDLVLGNYMKNSYSGQAWVFFSTLLDDVGTTTGNTKPLSTATNYNIRYDGTASSRLTDSRAIAIGDVNGDGLGDLVLGGRGASNNGADSGSAWVMFSTLIDDVGATTGNNKPLSTATNYNIRYDGIASILLTMNGFLSVGDVNGDGLNDLVLGTSDADNNGTNSGSAWVMFSTLIDDVGATTGNNKPLSTAGNYNVRYDGGAANDYLKSVAIGDVNGDGSGDLMLGAGASDSNGADAGSVWVMFSTLIDDVGTSTGNNKPLSTATNYNIRYAGQAAAHLLSSVTTGDVNGDGLGDLVTYSVYAGNNGSSSGSAWVMFSTLIDDVGTSTGNNKPLSTATNYNIRYDGGAAGDGLERPSIGDVNGDGLGDLVLSAYGADNNGSSSGSAWVMFSTLIDDVGATTGNNKPLSTATNYNVRYDGGAASDQMTYNIAPGIGDMNGDGLGDLVLSAYSADNNGASSGSAWIMFSTLIDDVGATTGNNKPLSTAGNYNVRYDGGAAGDQLANTAPGIGDINGDGLGDLVLSAYRADNNGADSGSAYIIPSTLLRAQAPQPQIQIRGGAQIRGKVSFQTHRPFNCGVDTVSDADGNVYNTVKIGTQCWMKQNLRVGTMVTAATTQTNNSTIEKWCYDNTLANCMTNNNPNHPDGGLYQWNEAMQYSTTPGARGICPAGWHIPTHDELTTLERAVCTSGTCATDFPYNTTTTGYRGTDEGTKLKPNGTSGFEFNLAGYGVSGSFYFRSTSGYLWSSSVSGANAWGRVVGSGSAQVYRGALTKSVGLPVRCVQD